MKNTDEYKKESPEEMDHDLVILLLGFRGFCPFFMPANKAAPKKEEAKPEPKVKKEPVRSAAELADLEEAYFAARETDTSVLIAEMAKHMDIAPGTVRKKLNKYPERFRLEIGRVDLIPNHDR